MQSYREVDWDTFWRWEILHREQDPVDFRRWKSDSSRELRQLPQGRDRDGRPPLILDSSCGLGFHAMAQHHLGFRVEGCDRNRLVLARAREAMQAEGMDIPTFEAAWESLGTTHPARYDLIFNDEVHQVRPKDELLAVCRSFRTALKPGGSFVFFYADATKPHNGPGHAQWDWDHFHRRRTAWEVRRDDLEVTLEIRPERAEETLVLEHHSYRIRESGTPERFESMTMARNYFWDWDHVVPLLKEAGFDQVDSYQFVNVYGNLYSMNLATRSS